MATLISYIYRLNCKCGRATIIEVLVDPKIDSTERLITVARAHRWQAGINQIGTAPNDICPICIATSG